MEYDNNVFEMLGMDSDPFRNGRDCCCIAHTCAGRYKRALNCIKNGNEDSAPLLKEMESSYKGILASGYRMCEIWAKVYVLEMSL